jgi:UDP-N-acetylglucosamine 2-epimerase (non-hydrolysing)
MMQKTIVTITGIRPDFIRMSFVFKELDANFNHILIHTGQHFDENLSGVFFEQLNIRPPDYTLDTGKTAANHFEQLAYLSTAIPNLFKEHNIVPDLILFLGDSNSVGVSFPLKKAGYKIGHIEAGMRSYDKRMLEEINRTVCDHCSDILFVYHEDYRQQLALENITKNVYVVGNTIVEPFTLFREDIFANEKRKDMILMDIHRPENFNYPERLKSILQFGNLCSRKYGLPVKLLYFKRLKDSIQTYGLESELGNIEIIDLLPYKEYLNTVYHCKFIISDSGTGQEEPALLNTPVIVPRDFTERPQSYHNNCSIQFKAENDNSEEVFEWLHMVESGELVMKVEWLGDGMTSKKIVDKIRIFLNPNQNIFPFNKFSISQKDYIAKSPYPYHLQDGFLEPELALSLQNEIMNIPKEQWDRYSNPFEQKYTLRDKYNFPPILKSLFDELQTPEFVAEISDLVGYKLILDGTRNFWGVHMYESGDKLDIHADAGLHPTNGLKKQVTLGIYLSYEWREEYGCCLEIWRGENIANDSAKLIEKVESIAPMFNRMVVFTCNDYSWHGNPEPAICPKNSRRIFVTISYLSENMEDMNKRKKAFFVPRPNDVWDEEKYKLRLLRSDAEKYKDVYNTY